MNPGIVPRAVSMLFDNKADMEAGGNGKTTVCISVEVLEIYNEEVRDLLAPSKKGGESGRESSILLALGKAVHNTRVIANTKRDVSWTLNKAQKKRCVKATKLNANSSRSHLIFTLHFETKDKETGLVRRRGKLHVCDLAGSERLSKSGATGTLREETKFINSSLTSLSNVIEKLQAGANHVPYHESKLTYLLKNSLEGNSKCLAVICCNPLSAHFKEGMCSLRFAKKVSSIGLKAKGNSYC